MNHTQPITLVAPRPVRIMPGRPAAFRPPSRASVRLTSAPTDGFARIAEHNDENVDPEDGNALGLRMPNGSYSFNHSDRMSPRMSPRLSPRMSPSRSSYSSDALEEFLSILRPSFYQHPSNPLFNRRNNNGTAPAQMPDLHTYKFGIHHAKSHSSASSNEDTATSPPLMDADASQVVDHLRRRLSLRNMNESPAQEIVWSADFEYKPFAPPSPVSRSHTRNPFQRHASYDTPATHLHAFASATPALPEVPSTSVSPARIPLPMPDGDEEHTLSVAV